MAEFSSLSPALAASLCQILMIEDCEADRFLYRRYLERYLDRPHTILAAETLGQGLELCCTEQPAVVLLDLNLPDGHGLDLFQLLAAEGVECCPAVIVLTGVGDERLAVQALKAGAVDYLPKANLTGAALANVVQQALRAQELQAELRQSQQRADFMAEVALSIHQGRNLEQVLTRIVQGVRQLLAADRVLVYQFQPDLSGAIVAEAVVPPWTASLGLNIVDTCFQSHGLAHYQNDHRVYTLADVDQAEITDCHRQLLEQFQVRANLVLPILLPSEQSPTQPSTPATLPWGLLIAHQCSGPRQWSTTDVDLLRQLSIQMAIALQRVELYQSLTDLNTALEAQVAERTQALATAEYRYRAVFENMFQFLGLLSPEGVLLEVNRAALEVGQLDREAVVGQPLWATLWWQDAVTAEQVRSALAEVAQGGEVRYETLIRSADQRLIPMDFSLRPLRNSQGQVGLILAEGRDLTEEKKLDFQRCQNLALLQASEQRYMGLAAASPVGILHLDPQGNCTYINPMYQRLTGLLLPVVQGQGWYGGIHPDDRAWVQAIWEQDLAQGQTSHTKLEYRLRPHQGQVRWVYEQVEVEQDGAGEVLSYVVTLTDVTDRRLMEQALVDSEAKSRAILAAIPDYLFRVDSQGNYREIVTYRSDICLFSQETQVLGRNMAEILPKNIAQYQLQYLQAALATGELKVYEQEVVRSGQTCYEEVRVIQSGADEVLFMIRDITDRCRSAQELQALNQQLEATVAQRTAALQTQKAFTQSILDTVPLAIFWKDTQSRFLGCNRLFTTFMGISSQEELIGHREQDFLTHRHEFEQYVADDQEVMKTGKSKLWINETITLETGEQRWLETHKTPLWDGKGQVIGLVGVFQVLARSQRR